MTGAASTSCTQFTPGNCRWAIPMTMIGRDKATATANLRRRARYSARCALLQVDDRGLVRFGCLGPLGRTRLPRRLPRIEHPVSDVADRGDQVVETDRGRIEHDRGPAGGEVDVGLVHARGVLEGQLDRARAGGAGHAGHRQRHLRGRAGFSGNGQWVPLIDLTRGGKPRWVSWRRPAEPPCAARRGGLPHAGRGARPSCDPEPVRGITLRAGDEAVAMEWSAWLYGRQRRQPDDVKYCA